MTCILWEKNVFKEYAKLLVLWPVSRNSSGKYIGLGREFHSLGVGPKQKTP